MILATEAHAAARLLDAQDPALALQLRAIPYASSIIVNVAYRRDQISHPLDGFGAVVPAIEGRSILAVSFLSVKFPNRAPAGTVLLRVFIGGATPARAVRPRRRGDQRPWSRSELAGLIGAAGEPLSCGSAAILARCPSTTSATSIASPRSAAISPSTPGSTWRASPTTASASPTASTPPN